LTWLGPATQFVTRRRDIGTLDLRLLLWALLPLAFFTLSIGKQPRYILPVLPPVAILLASSIIERTSEWRSLDGARRTPRPNMAVVMGCVTSGLFLVMFATLLYRARALFLGVPEINSIVVAAVIALGGVATVVVGLSSAWRSAPGLLAFATALALAVLPYGVFADSGDSTVKTMAERVREARGAEDIAVATYKVFVRNLVFYSGLQHTDIINDDHLRQWLAQNPRALIVMSSADATLLAANSGLSVERLAELPYFNEGVIKLRVLLWPDPATDLEKVVLVRVTARPSTASQD
jgi:4-amino-4-deoxy-L-arabinose transferase-like glycosyltransferase